MELMTKMQRGMISPEEQLELSLSSDKPSRQR